MNHLFLFFALATVCIVTVDSEVQNANIFLGRLMLSRRRRSVADKAPTGNTCANVIDVPADVVTKYNLNTTFYKKYTSAYGIPILGSTANSSALQRACYVVRFMLADRRDLRDHMYTNKGRAAIIALDETVPMVPELSALTGAWFTTRGAGGTSWIPVTVGAEENLLCWPEDAYSNLQDIFMHEFAHAIHLVAASTALPNFDNNLKNAYNAAKAAGRWNNTYAGSHYHEYFAEGVQAYFDAQTLGKKGGNGIQNDINTREKLKNYDPTLYGIIQNLFPCDNTFIPRCTDVDQKKSLAEVLTMNCEDLQADV